MLQGTFWLIIQSKEVILFKRQPDAMIQLTPYINTNKKTQVIQNLLAADFY